VSLRPFTAAAELPLLPEKTRWLVEGLWAEQAVGIVGGEPKCCKSFLALSLAVSVASGTPCLGRFASHGSGRVLLYAAEDALPVVRERLDGLCRAAGLHLSALDIQVITAKSLRIDVAADQRSLVETVAHLRPRLLVLDPFVRLHRIDENASSEVAPLLAFLRDLQRDNELSVILVHHARKGASSLRDGQALRGSSEFHAWGDSNLYLRRSENALSLAIEHRAAPSRSGIALRLLAGGGAFALEIVDPEDMPTLPARVPSPAADERILGTLAATRAPLSLSALRQRCRIRTETLCRAVNELLDQGRIDKTPAGYCLARS
jgi:hypothetical protein